MHHDTDGRTYADFAELADANSIDAQAGAGGTIGCLDTQAFGEEFGTAAEAAAFGEVVGPISSEQGTHLIVVNEKTKTLGDVWLNSVR